MLGKYVDNGTFRALISIALQYTQLCCGPTDKQRRYALCPLFVPFVQIVLGTIPSDLHTTALKCSQNLAQNYTPYATKTILTVGSSTNDSTTTCYNRSPFSNVSAITVKQANSQCCNLSQLICTTPTIPTPYTSKEQPVLQDHRNNFIPSFLATPPPT